MAKSKSSQFDTLVDRLIGEFVKIPNFDLLSTEDSGRKAFNLIAFRMSDIHAYKSLICNHFFPATNKAIFDGMQDIRKSKYSSLFKIHDLEFKETLYETVRWAYVGLFHKLENYVNDVIRIPDIIFGELFYTNEPIDKWLKKELQFDLRDWKRFSITNRINWICNCVKHKDGYPTKDPKPVEFRNIDETIRLTLTPDEFKTDCELLIKAYEGYLQSIILFATYRFALNNKPSEQDRVKSPDFYQDQMEKFALMEHKVTEFIKGLRED